MSKVDSYAINNNLTTNDTVVGINSVSGTMMQCTSDAISKARACLSMHTTSAIIDTLSTADTYENIPLATVSAKCVKSFSIVNDTFIYSGGDLEGVGKDMSVHGFAYLTVDKACTLTISLFKNGVVENGLVVPIVLAPQTKDDIFIMLEMMAINTNDVIELKIKSSVANTTYEMHNGSFVIKE